MDQSDLLALIEKEESDTVSMANGELAEQRREALQYFQGRPYGNEIEGRSGVVTTEVRDAVLGLLPIIMDIFTASDEIVRCDPQGPEDEQAAQQASDWLNYKFSRGTEGWKALYSAVFDALLQKNGYIKVYWEEYEKNGVETYEGLTPDEFYFLQAKPELEVEDVEETEGGINVTFRLSGKKGRICLEGVPPEEILVARDTGTDLEKARFVEHRKLCTISEIRQMGYDVDDDIAGDRHDADLSYERQQRFLDEGASDIDVDDTKGDPSMRKVWLREAYVNVDYDDDGIAELRKIVVVGTEILENEEFDSLPIVCGQVLMMPHKHYGLSIHDVIGDIQLIKSTVTRQLLDNAYQANNSRVAVLDNMVNMDDLLTSRPGGVVRTKVMGAVQPLQPQLLGPSFYNLLEYFDQMKTNRVGTNDFPQGADPNAINAKAAYHDAFQRGAMLRPSMMARTMAETLVKPLFYKMLELGSKHQNKPEMMRLRNQWVPVDPRGWKDKFDLTVTVGLGTGSQQQILQGAMGILQVQAQMAQMTMGRVANESNLYHAAHRFAKAVFPRDADMFFTNPAGLPPPQPQPDPELLKIQAGQEKAQMADAFRRTQLQAQMMDSELERRFEAMLKQMEEQSEKRALVFQAQLDAAVSAQDAQKEMWEARLKEESEQRKAFADAVAQINVAREQGVNEKQLAVLKGMIDESLQAQKAMFDQQLEKQRAKKKPKEKEAEGS